MNKTAIKNFAVWARNKLIADITYKAGLIGVSEKGIAQPLPQSSNDLQFFDIGTKEYAKVEGSDIEQRNALIRAIQEKERTSDYNTAFKAVIEEVAYTWFNRLIAIRFMEVNDYLPSRIRVLSSENPAKNEPDFVTTPFDTDMEFTAAEQDRIMQLKDENKLDELFRMLFIKQCNKLHEILPDLFEKTNDYTELLLSISFTDNDGIVYHLVHDIPEDDFNVEKEGQVEIIGWMYQYYNIEPKDETFALLKKNVKITKERIPAATQLFTPDWIVRYMVENSLGRIYVDKRKHEGLYADGPGIEELTWEQLEAKRIATEKHIAENMGWKYYLPEAEQSPNVRKQLDEIWAEYENLNVTDIKVIDPCMGSGHILVYCFDVLMQIYEARGYTQRDAAQSILENNLFGLDIDKRAAQLAYFAVMMKARQYDRRILIREIKPHVYSIEESNGINREQLKYFGDDLSPIERNKAKLQITGLLDTMTDAKEYGSILNVENYDWELLQHFAESIDDASQMSLDTIGIDQTQNQLLSLIEIARVMAQKYEVVVTNPPYMGASGMSARLSQYVKDNYPDSKADLFACFIDKGNRMTIKNGYNCMVTMQSWMFLSSFEKMRTQILTSKTITNLMHMENMVMGIAFGTAVTVFNNSIIKKYRGTYNHITLKDIDDGKPREFPVTGNRFAQICTENFAKIPGSPIAYWVSEKVIDSFTNLPSFGELADPRQGLATGNDEEFLRYWHEIVFHSFSDHCTGVEEMWDNKYKYVPFNKGGAFRKWYGNNLYIIRFDKQNYAKLSSQGNKLPSRQFYFLEGITWSALTSGMFSCRYCAPGYVFAGKGPMCFVNKRENAKLFCALMNSKCFEYFYRILSATMDFNQGPMRNLPYADPPHIAESIADDCIELCKADWDSFETSWDFLVHPLVLASEVHDLNGGHKATLADSYAKWELLCEKRFNQLKTNEEELNRIFIDIYRLQDELTPDVEDKDVTVRKANLQRDIKSLLSYAVGCMFGRYSLDEPGLAYAGGEWDNRKYSTFIPDKDNCIPITDEEYFDDDIVGRFCTWLKTVYGETTLEENLDFIANALGNKGATSREVIRNYFLNDFIKDHIKIYQKRPIYWLFDSGKQNGFKALVYMHRWNADTVGNLRVEYLHRMQHTYEREIIRMQENIDNSRDSREVSKATKIKDKLQKQLKETKDYDAKLAHIALSRIEIDLDDGVKVNYEKVQTGRDGKKMQILAKI